MRLVAGVSYSKGSRSIIRFLLGVLGVLSCGGGEEALFEMRCGVLEGSERRPGSRVSPGRADRVLVLCVERVWYR